MQIIPTKKRNIEAVDQEAENVSPAEFTRARTTTKINIGTTGTSKGINAFALGDKKKMLLYSIYSVILLAQVFGISYLGFKLIDYKRFVPIDAGMKTLELPNTAVSQGNTSVSQTPKVPIVRDQENPVNGVMVTKAEIDEMKSRKLVVVSINNHTKARPQFGLSKADLVLEVLAEGGITRYNAYYYQDQTVTKVGPIRSARTYMLYNLSGYDDPVFVHEGQASYTSHDKVVPEINALQQIREWHIKSMQTAGSRYRDKERIKSAGYVHSLMTSFPLINKEVVRLGWKSPSNITPLAFKYDALEEARGVAVEATSTIPEAKVASTIEVKFSSISGNYYKCKFEYDKQTNTYLRSIAGKPDTDALDGTRIAPKNVIVEYHNYRDAMDGHSRIVIDMLGEGEVFVFRDGQMIQGTWKKATRTDRTQYYDKNGEKIELNRGQIWLVNAIRTKDHKVSDMTVDGKLIK